VIIRDPVVVSATLPRFMNVGDHSQMHLAIDNVEGAAGAYALEIAGVTGALSSPTEALKKALTLAKGGKDTYTLPLHATAMGTTTLDVKLTGPANFAASQSLKLRVQPTGNALVRRTVRQLDANGGTFTLTPDVFTDLLKGSGQASISVSPYAALDVPAILASLDRYPYGCTEQTISRALPLLYVNKLSKQEHLALDTSIDERIRTAIERVLSRQGADGSFGLWGVGGSDLWLDAFVGDFLTRAREGGFEVSKTAYQTMLDRLRNQVTNAGDVESKDAPAYAYALYVLARNGRPVMGDLRYLADTKMGVFSTPLSKAQIGASLALLGDRTRAQSVFESALKDMQSAQHVSVWRADYGSRLRDSSGLLTLLAENNSEAPLIQKASVVVENARSDSRYTSTQENAWMVLAAQAVAKEAEGLTLKVDDTAQTGALYRNYKEATLIAKPVTITNTSAVPARLVLGVSGFPTTPEPAVNKGFGVERKIYKLDGTQVWPPLPARIEPAKTEGAKGTDKSKEAKPAPSPTPSSAPASTTDTLKVKQNDRFVMVLTVSEGKANYGQVMLVDPLPAGFEIDNSKLVSGTDLAALPWLKQDVEPDHTEYRDDRFVAAFTRTPSQSAIFTVAYTVRAVSPGQYVHPGAFVEDMYRPDIHGRSAFGKVEVVKEP
jgi:alpha-2-macroglobulin